jgi:hypothetical protein
MATTITTTTTKDYIQYKRKYLENIAIKENLEKARRNFIKILITHAVKRRNSPINVTKTSLTSQWRHQCDQNFPQLE